MHPSKASAPGACNANGSRRDDPRRIDAKKLSPRRPISQARRQPRSIEGTSPLGEWQPLAAPVARVLERLARTLVHEEADNAR